jgi:hypothetical protein
VPIFGRIIRATGAASGMLCYETPMIKTHSHLCENPIMKPTLRIHLHALQGITFTLFAAATANAQELITNGEKWPGI